MPKSRPGGIGEFVDPRIEAGRAVSEASAPNSPGKGLKLG